jgi:hypothetical protein
VLLKQQAARTAPVPAGERVFASDEELELGDLVRFQDRFVAAAREGPDADGRVRLLTSADGRSFTSLALVEKYGADLSHPRLSATPDGRLLLLCEASGPEGSPRGTLIAESHDGAAWTTLGPPGGSVESGSILVGLAWSESLGCTALVLHEDPRLGTSLTRPMLYQSTDGLTFQKRKLEFLLPAPAGNGGFIPWSTDAVGGLLADAEGEERSFLLRGLSDASQVTEVARGIAGATLLAHPDGSLLVGTRDGEKGPAQVLRIAPDGACSTALELPGSAGPGGVVLLEQQGELWIAYATGAGDGSALYVARVDLAGL